MGRGKVTNIWDVVASEFGKVGPDYWGRFGNRLAQLSNIMKGAIVLDIGFGRGASMFPASERTGEQGRVIGIDSSYEMVSETLKEIKARKIDNIEVKVMNASEVSFKACYFDNVICGFGIGYLLYSDEKLNGVKRILKNGGQAAFSVWAEQEDQRWLSEIVNKYTATDKPEKTALSDVQRIKFDTEADIFNIFAEAGFKNIRVHQEDADIIYKDKDEWWQEMNANAVRNIFESIKKQGDYVFDQFKKDIFLGLDSFQKEDGLHFNMPVIYAFGEK